MKHAIIVWEDAYTATGNVEINEITDQLTLHTIGWLVQETDESVSIAVDADLKEGTFRDLATIPKRNIKSMMVIDIDLWQPKLKRKYARKVPVKVKSTLP